MSKIEIPITNKLPFWVAPKYYEDYLCFLIEVSFIKYLGVQNLVKSQTISFFNKKYPLINNNISKPLT